MLFEFNKRSPYHVEKRNANKILVAQPGLECVIENRRRRWGDNIKTSGRLSAGVMKAGIDISGRLL
jgi:hypothetical protein